MDASINPELLVWARETAGLSLEEVARRSGVSLSRIAKVELGEAHLTTIQLEKYAEACRRPVAAFYLPKPPKVPEIIPDFRRLENHEPKAFSTELRLEIRRAQLRRIEAIELAAEVEEPLKNFTLSFSKTTLLGEAGANLRRYLGITLQAQLAWRKPESALKEWKRAAEAVGVLVFEVSRIPVGEMRGIAVSLRPLPIVILNGADEPSARIFSLFHELAHLALNVSAIDDGSTEGEGLSAQDARTERFCNEVAGEALVPSEFVEQFLKKSSESTVDLDSVANLARQLSVSRDVVARRFLSQGRIDQTLYQKWHRHFKDEYEKFIKDRKLKAKASKSGPSFEVIQARNLSQTFVRLAFDAYEQDYLSLSSVSGLLGMKVKSVFALRDLVREGAGR